MRRTLPRIANADAARVRRMGENWSLAGCIQTVAHRTAAREVADSSKAVGERQSNLGLGAARTAHCSPDSAREWIRRSVPCRWPHDDGRDCQEGFFGWMVGSAWRQACRFRQRSGVCPTRRACGRLRGDRRRRLAWREVTLSAEGGLTHGWRQT